MSQFLMKPTLHCLDSVKQFAEEFAIGEGDLLFTSRHFYDDFFAALDLKCDFIYPKDYGKGEPTDEMIEAMARDITKDYKRIIGVGGGSVLDVAKFFVLDQVVSRSTKAGYGNPAMFPDNAVLIPELLESLPMEPFSTSAIDALVHAVESALSPKATPIGKLLSYKAIDLILNGFKTIVADGPESRKPLLEDFLFASTYAGVAFSNAGCAAVHALSYPLGGTFHVPHGESNYAMFTGVMRAYMKIRQDGEIAVLNARMADILNHLVQKKPLHEYGMTEAQITEFADAVHTGQQRLLVNNFVPLSRDQIEAIYRELY